MDSTTDRVFDLQPTETGQQADLAPNITDEARARLGAELRSLYAVLCEAEPITDMQVDLLLQLRHRERDRQRVA